MSTDNGIIFLSKPTRCVLWQEPGRAKDWSLFAEIARYEDSSHLTRKLVKCTECGHLYFYEWSEWVDWDDGDDKQYTTLFPVVSDAEVEAMKSASSFELMGYFPRLHLDGEPSWNGKD